MSKLTVMVSVTMQMRDGETEEQAQERFYTALYDGLCNNAEHEIEFSYDGIEFEE